jgi:hypothetical protein
MTLVVDYQFSCYTKLVWFMSEKFHFLTCQNFLQNCTQLMLQRRPNQTELRLMEIFISKFYVDSKKVSEKFLHRHYPVLQIQKVRGVLLVFLKVFAHLSAFFKIWNFEIIKHLEFLALFFNFSCKIFCSHAKHSKFFHVSKIFYS